MLEHSRQPARGPVAGDGDPGKGARSRGESTERYVTGRERLEIIARVREDAGSRVGTPSTWSPGDPGAA